MMHLPASLVQFGLKRLSNKPRIKRKEKKKIIICFRAFANDRDASEWYVFDLTDAKFDCNNSIRKVKDDESTEGRGGSYCNHCYHSHPYCHHRNNTNDDKKYALKPLVSCKMSRFASWAVLPDSYVFCVGCYEAPPDSDDDSDCQRLRIGHDVGKPQDQVYRFDAFSSEPSWIACPKMYSARKEPQVLILDCHVFVIGGVYPSDNEDYNDDDDDDDDNDDHICLKDDKLVDYHNDNPDDQEEPEKMQATVAEKRDSSSSIGEDGPQSGWMVVSKPVYSSAAPWKSLSGYNQYNMKGRPSNSSPWGEVYEPNYRSWKPLPEPPSRPSEDYGSGFICAAMEDDKTILVGSAEENVLYSYSLKTDSWTTLEGHKLDPSCSGKAVVVNRTLYWFTALRHLVVYDTDNKKYYQGAIDANWDQTILGTYCFRPGLLHLESNMFCLLWTHTEIFDRSDSLQRSHLHCLKFQVSLKPPGDDIDIGELSVSIKSCHSRPIDHGVTFVDSVVV